MGWILLLSLLVLQVVTETFAQRMKAPNDDILRFKCQIYQQNKTKVEEHNKNPSATYKLELNEFACLTTEEINNYYLGYIPSIQASVYFAKKGMQKDLPSKNIRSVAMLASPTITQAQILSKMVGSRSFTRANPINIQSNLEQQMRAQVQNYFQDKNIPESTLQKYLTKKNQRLLQSESGPSASQSGFLINPVNLKKETVSTVPTNEGNQTQHSTQYDVDWSCLGGRVKFQGKCLSNYAFSAIDTVATMLAIYQYGFHLELSIQEVIDCPKILPGATFPLTYGCNGGYIEGAFAYMIHTGVLPEYEYPYTSQRRRAQDEPSVCKGESSKVARHFISNFEQIAQNNCDQLKIHLKHQPIAVAISIDRLALYKEGIFNDCRPEDDLNHAVMLVGYKEGKGWKFKNSWKQSWGDNGYGWLAPGNTCRICEKAFYPIPKIGQGLDNYNSGKPIRTCPPP